MISVLLILQVVWIDILLSGDNAVVVAMACRGLPESQRTIGIVAGVALAVIMRIVCSVFLASVLDIPYLKVVGGVMLAWIAVDLIRGEDGDVTEKSGSKRLFSAVITVAMADLIMSTDNIMAIVGVSHGNVLVFIIGLLVSMPLMIVGASAISAVVARLPWLVWAGGALLGWIAMTMAFDDIALSAYAPNAIQAGLGGALGAVLIGYMWRQIDRYRRFRVRVAK